jgi:hypothetical protein
MATGDGIAAEVEEPAEDGAVAEVEDVTSGAVAEPSHPAIASAASNTTGTARNAVVRAIDLDPLMTFGLAVD